MLRARLMSAHLVAFVEELFLGESSPDLMIRRQFVVTTLLAAAEREQAGAFIPWSRSEQPLIS